MESDEKCEYQASWKQLASYSSNAKAPTVGNAVHVDSGELEILNASKILREHTEVSAQIGEDLKAKDPEILSNSYAENNIQLIGKISQTLCVKKMDKLPLCSLDLKTLFTVITLLLILRQRYRKDVNILGKNVAEIHEQLVTYDEEGGGEMDTTSYDVSVLNSVRRNVMTPRMEMAPGPCLYAKVKKPARNGDMGVMIEVKKDEADNDGDMLPYDTLHIFGYEGSESIVESLSSLESGSSDSDIDYDVLNDWGPRFKMLADLYGLEHNDLFEY